MLDGAAKVAPLFAEAGRLGMPAVGMTDHGNMYGADEFYREAEKTGIKRSSASRHTSRRQPLPQEAGLLGPVPPRGHRRPRRGRRRLRWRRVHHMTMLAENATGLRNLFKLSSEASFTGFYRKPRCLLPGQEIMTRGGMKRIEDIRVGDEVLTHRGRFRRVVELMRNAHQGTSTVCG